MMDFGCHRIEVLLSLFGEVVEVGALRGNVLYDRAVEDTAIATLRFARGPLGIVTVTHAADEPRDSLDIYGSEGSLHIGSLNGDELRIVRKGVERRESHPHAENAHQPLIEHSCSTDCPPKSIPTRIFCRMNCYGNLLRMKGQDLLIQHGR